MRIWKRRKEEVPALLFIVWTKDHFRVPRDTTAIDQMVAGDRPFRAELVVRFPTRSEQVPQHCTRYFR
jgi:hypothetical protein